jgi:hypothetical protein
MKATALAVSALLMCGTAAFAQQQQDPNARGEESVRAEQQEHGTASGKTRDTMHKLGDKTRHAMHRMGDAARRVAHRGKDKNDTTAMGAAPSTSSDAAAARQRRMDDAYANWQARQQKTTQSR